MFLFRSERKFIKIPWDIEDLKLLSKVLDHYKDKYYFQVMGGIVTTYILYPFKFKILLLFIIILKFVNFLNILHNSLQTFNIFIDSFGIYIQISHSNNFNLFFISCRSDTVLFFIIFRWKTANSTLFFFYLMIF